MSLRGPPLLSNFFVALSSLVVSNEHVQLMVESILSFLSTLEIAIEPTGLGPYIVYSILN